MHVTQMRRFKRFQNDITMLTFKNENKSKCEKCADRFFLVQKLHCNVYLCFLVSLSIFNVYFRPCVPRIQCFVINK